jgi:HEAT repeat protein
VGIAVAFPQISLCYAQDHSTTQIEELIAALRSPNGNVREEAITSLARIGPTATPALITALSNADPTIRQGAALALGRIGPAPAETAPALIAALEDPDSKVRVYAARALGEIGPAAAAAVPALITALDEPNLDLHRVLTGMSRILLARIGSSSSVDLALLLPV